MEFVWTAPDGESFPCEEWLPAGKPSGMILCVPGMGGSAGDFRPVGEAASAAGHAVYALNLRGQGMDRAPRRGAWLELPLVAADIDAFAKMATARHEDAPLFLCGESMGSLVMAWLLANRAISVPVRGAIFSVPVVELSRPTPVVVRLAVRVLSMVLPTSRLSPAWFVNGKAEPLKLTRDEGHWEKLRGAPHYIPIFAFRFLNSLGNLIESSSTLATKLETPCLVLAAGNDAFLRAEQVERWFAKIAATDKTFQLYPEAYHLLWHDWDRELVLKDILDWVGTRR
ncbi:hypothetical protein BH09VER1_BH09VER1_01060 [soil metagenome]